jgi:predicted enzyme related to lactoylglutathione lyase
MPNKLAHFAIEAEDVERALKFYESVYGALQKRREPLPSGRKGYECSFAVFDIDTSSKSIEAAGGRLLGPKHAIPTICELRQFADTEGNEALICQYAPDRLKEMGLA